ncbi:Golgi-associated plant pathogenesis-related protein 1 [Trichoplax sp. H2]|nr:Golgi-associated plant pathogenesis-related protein 1 [Trichoplax sp. H2]|eukprot:RDD40428.1 Golgi-associated plant pathogenesis-related protein 1 [Trichoplax sp. H2]
MPFGFGKKSNKKKDKVQIFHKEVLAVHNELRANHAAPALKWSEKCARSAQVWADQLAKMGRLQHKVEDNMGQNLAFVYSSDGKNVTGEQIVNMWYDEIKDYNFKNATFSSGTGHFTQVVWVGSKEVGVGISSTPDGKVFVVANYLPAGNMMGQFAENVNPPQSAHGGQGRSKSKFSKGKQPSASSSSDTGAGAKSKDPKRRASVRCVANANLTEFQSEMLIVHNEMRERHRSSALKWSDSCATSAQEWADQLARMGKLQHKTEGDMGQNLAYMKTSLGNQGDIKAEEIANMWYNEVKDYNYKKAEFQPSTGHFTQLVWAETEFVGVGIASTADGRVFIVANYSPAGNVQGKYGINVKKPRGKSKFKKLFARKNKGTNVTGITSQNDGASAKSKRKGRKAKATSRGIANENLSPFLSDVLMAHNDFRSKHGAQPLGWSSRCADTAQAWADQLVKMGRLQHKKEDNMGQNLAYKFTSNPDSVTGQEMVQMWYDEIKNYNFKAAKFGMNTGHFTQLVWADTVEMGAGVAQSADGQIYLVANYSPPGNVMGKFKENVYPVGTKNPKKFKKSLAKKAANSVRDKARRKPGAINEKKLGSFKDVSLDAHNNYRAKHGAPPLKWSKECTTHAKKWADYLAKNKKFEHSHQKGFGENLACFMGSAQKEITGHEAVDMWYDEIKDYNFRRATFTPGTGHFTQVVWRETTEVGVAMAKGKNNYTVVVANYKPAGNMMGKFKENVLPPN